MIYHNSNICFFTGHRRLYHDESAITEALTAEIKARFLRGYTEFAAGGAVGFDMLASLAVLKLRREYGDFREIKLRLVLPCPPSLQSRRWSNADRAAYLPVYDEADSIEITGTACNAAAMFTRNDRLVTLGGCGICYLAGEKAGVKSGGTVYTVNRAKRRGIGVCNIAEILDGNVTPTLPFADDSVNFRQ